MAKIREVNTMLKQVYVDQDVTVELDEKTRDRLRALGYIE